MPPDPIEIPVNPAWEVHPAEVRDRLIRGETLLVLDVRQVGEWNRARIEGAVLIPLPELGERAAAELAPWREKPIAVLCHHGVRSLRATMFLRSLGFEMVHSIAGGIEAWSVAVDSAVPRY